MRLIHEIFPGADNDGCAECGLDFLRESEQDRRIHELHHDEFVNGIRVPAMKPTLVVGHHEEFEILLTTDSRAPETAFLERAATNANSETGYDGGLLDAPNLDLGVQVIWACAENRIAGVALIDTEIRSGYALSLPDLENALRDRMTGRCR